MRERRKEPREGSEIDPETACIQTVGAPALMPFDAIAPAMAAKEVKEGVKARILFLPMLGERGIRAGVTAYHLYNGSATYVMLRA